MKLVLFVALVVLCGFAVADVFSQLQFMKIISPTSGQTVAAGDKLTIKYAMQPLVYKQTSNGYATSLVLNFHKRSGNTKQGLLENISPNCPIAAEQSKFKTYTKQWTVPANTAPGSYALDFVETVQLRRGKLTASETVKITIVD
ncbi:uncharacterized protein EV154DRAFT_430242 [Mucor mucedo]|uniref:Uncharacterized protein n=1 Tax=Mucor saturninus TaxID=64648 RepID=A0A8H7QR75_9FUNG|nr:uncharacterized protein EV154DRAFT_430242 [Mucor mucedo]KAG2197044.1 hypothetical protein INT47_009760 [Mucor saturninus]KAI7874793.1 hypothetical protein EV154DRAFT_430242 [Mucor mucedo]